MMHALVRTAGLLAIVLSVPAWAQDGASAPAAPAALPTLQLPLPQPFPLPYQHVTLTPRDDNEAVYLNYLRTSQVFPDQALCTRELERRVEGKIKPDGLKIDWVTPPFLAWGGKIGGDAIVGPIEHLYSITEAHITFEQNDGNKILATFACFAKYADVKESDIWRAGHVKYGAYVNAGHGKYTSGPARIFTHAPSGSPTVWEKEIRYLRK